MNPQLPACKYGFRDAARLYGYVPSGLRPRGHVRAVSINHLLCMFNSFALGRPLYAAIKGFQ
jgi:hypothetical protein